jgi:RNA polymerase sigma factor (sigma-70 family)
MNIDKIYKQYRNYLVRVAAFRTKDYMVAEEIVNDVFVHVWSHFDDDMPTPYKYIFAAICNRCIDHHKSWYNKNNVVSEDVSFYNHASEQGANTESKIDLSILCNVLPCLKPAQQRAVKMHYLDGLSYREIAKVIKKNRKTIRLHAISGVASMKYMLKVS